MSDALILHLTIAGAIFLVAIALILTYIAIAPKLRIWNEKRLMRVRDRTRRQWGDLYRSYEPSARERRH